MSRNADILVRTRGGRPLAVIQVKNLPRLLEIDAVDLRDALAQRRDEVVRYVMIVSQSAGYLWQLQAEPSGAAERYGRPQILDMYPVFRAYLSEEELSRHLRGTELDLILSHWLGDLTRGCADLLPRILETGPLSNLVADIRDAQVRFEAVA